MLTAIAVMGIILSVLPLVVLAIFNNRYAARIGVPFMFVIIAAATGLLVYNNLSKPRRMGRSETIVDEFREWQSGSYDRKSLRRAVSSALWAILIAIYFIISFWTGAWHISWIIFLFGAAIEAILNIFIALRK